MSGHDADIVPIAYVSAPRKNRVEFPSLRRPMRNVPRAVNTEGDFPFPFFCESQRYDNREQGAQRERRKRNQR